MAAGLHLPAGSADDRSVSNGPAADEHEWVSDRAVVGFIGGLFGVLVGAAVLSAILPVPYAAAALALSAIWAVTFGRSMLTQAFASNDDPSLRRNIQPVRPAWLLRSFVIACALVLRGLVALL